MSMSDSHSVPSTMSGGGGVATTSTITFASSGGDSGRFTGSSDSAANADCCMSSLTTLNADAVAAAGAGFNYYYSNDNSGGDGGGDSADKLSFAGETADATATARLLPTISASSSAPSSSSSSSGGPGGGDVVKCVVVGDAAVGKTALVLSYTTNAYPTEYVPTTFDRYTVSVTVDDQPVVFQLCDVTGNEFEELRPLWYAGAHVFLVCFSVVRPDTLRRALRHWLPQLRRFQPHAPALLVGTQTDLRTDVQVLIDLSRVKQQPICSAEGRKAALQSRCSGYHECSALTQSCVKDVFDQCLVLALQQNRQHQQQKSSSVAPSTTTETGAALLPAASSSQVSPVGVRSHVIVAAWRRWCNSLSCFRQQT